MLCNMKPCSKCGQQLPLAAFYRHPGMADGHLNSCRDCVKARVREHRAENLKRIRAYDRERANKPERLAAMKRTVASYEARHPERKAANNALNNAVRDGRVVKPCACWACGETRRVVGHHFDYSQPLLVSWLCQVCHKDAHRITDQAVAA